MELSERQVTNFALKVGTKQIISIDFPSVTDVSAVFALILESRAYKSVSKPSY